MAMLQERSHYAVVMFLEEPADCSACNDFGGSVHSGSPVDNTGSDFLCGPDIRIFDCISSLCSTS